MTVNHLPLRFVAGPAGCVEIYAARRALNEVAMQGMLETMEHNTTRESPDTLYLIRAMDPNGEKHGVYAPRPPCPVDEPCPLAARHGYFESAPNHDSVGLRVADDDLAASIYQSMISIEGLRPCAFVSPRLCPHRDQIRHIIVLVSFIPPSWRAFCA